MILGGNLDLAGQQIFNRMIAAAVAEFQLVGMQAVGQRDHLMAQTDAEDRLFALKLTDQINDLRHVFRIARPVGQEDAVWIERHDRFIRSVVRHDCDVAAIAVQLADDVVFDAAVNRNDIEARIGAAGIPFFPARDARDQILWGVVGRQLRHRFLMGYI